MGQPLEVTTSESYSKMPESNPVSNKSRWSALKEEYGVYRRSGFASYAFLFNAARIIIKKEPKEYSYFANMGNEIFGSSTLRIR